MKMPCWPNVSILETFSNLLKESMLRKENFAPLFDKQQLHIEDASMYGATIFMTCYVIVVSCLGVLQQP